MSRTVPAPIRIAPPPEDWGATRVRRPRRAPAARSKDRPVAAMVFGILSLFFNALFLPSLIGILYGAGSLRAGTTRRTQAVVGIVCGSVGAVLGLTGIVLLILGRLVLPSLAGQALERTVETSAARSGVTLSSIHCPRITSFTAGDSITCTAVESGRGPVSVVVTVGPSNTVSLQLASTA